MLLKRGLIRLWIALSALWLICALSLGWIIGSDTFDQVSKANARIEAMQAGKFSAMAYLDDQPSGETKVCVYPVFKELHPNVFDQFDDPTMRPHECNLPSDIVAKTLWGRLSQTERKEWEASRASNAKPRFVPDWDLPEDLKKHKRQEPARDEKVAKAGLRKNADTSDFPDPRIRLLEGLKKDDVKAFLIAKEQELRNEKVMSLGRGFVLVGLLPPLVLLALGFIAAWVIAGFRSDPRG